MRKISVIIPSKQEPNVHKLVEQIEREITPYQIIISNDRCGKGKGWATREGLEIADGNMFVFIDGDGDIDAKEINKLLGYEYCIYDVVLGKKKLPKRLDRKVLTILSRVFLFLVLGITEDTQTGAKLFNYKPDWKTDLWGFDAEIIYKAKKMGKSICEVDINATVSDSKSTRDIVSTINDIIKIRMGL